MCVCLQKKPATIVLLSLKTLNPQRRFDFAMTHVSHRLQPKHTWDWSSTGYSIILKKCALSNSIFWPTSTKRMLARYDNIASWCVYVSLYNCTTCFMTHAGTLWCERVHPACSQQEGMNDKTPFKNPITISNKIAGHDIWRQNLAWYEILTNTT